MAELVAFFDEVGELLFEGETLFAQTGGCLLTLLLELFALRLKLAGNIVVLRA